MSKLRLTALTALMAIIGWHGAMANSIPKTLPLWPKKAPGETGTVGREHTLSSQGDDVVRITDVTKPTITVYRPSGKLNAHTAVLVCPGGGYQILAMNLEGTEIAHWLNRLGITAVVLKYRVPRRKGRKMWSAPLQDGQRAMGLIREHAKAWKIDPQRIGAIGFSAGGNLVANLSTNCASRTYSHLDRADALPCRPNFTMLIYPAYMTVDEKGHKLAPQLSVSTKTPPTFMVVTEDDDHRAAGCWKYFQALKQANVAAELHIYPAGGHGYGLRSSKFAVSTWPARAQAWMEHRGVLKR